MAATLDFDNAYANPNKLISNDIAMKRSGSQQSIVIAPTKQIKPKNSVFDVDKLSVSSI
jgi:hypothetical protein